MVDEKDDTDLSAPKKPETLEELLEKGRIQIEKNANLAKCSACGVEIEAGTICEACAVSRRQGARVKAALSTVPSAYAEARFGTEEIVTRVASAEARRVAQASCYEGRVAILGASGAGKTTLAVAMLRDRAYFEQLPPESCLFLPAWRLAGWGRTDIASQAMECDLLLLDDLGSDREFPTSPVTGVIFGRFDACRPTWVTTWMTPAQVTARYGDGIARRIFSLSTVIDCG
jgi:DNA replication protein DnaC